jgi:RNA polymerase sigma factor for flagellar operon FliA
VLQPLRDDQQERVIASRTFVEALARRLAASMPGGVDVGDLVQDGMIGLIDAMHRFDEARGIRFETFAERRVRGAMIDALRRDAWPRGIRRQRRELEAAREALRARNGGAEPSIADLAAHLGTDVDRLGRTILRITTIEATSATSSGESGDGDLPAGCVPTAPPSPDEDYVVSERRGRLRRAMASLDARDRQLLTLYYFHSATMKDIGAALGVNESRVSQLHARALTRLKQSLLAAGYTDAMSPLAPLVDIQEARTRRQQATRAATTPEAADDPAPRGIVLPYPTMSRTARSNSASRKGLASQRQPVSSRKRAASDPVTSPVTKITRRA